MTKPAKPEGALSGFKGLRVLDFTWAGAGPYATALLAQMGADVVKIETPTRPDMMRDLGRIYGYPQASIDESACFNDINAGKRSMAINLKVDAELALARRLASVADVVCDNMRTGKMEALGLGYEALRESNPDVICCSVSATGRVPGAEPRETDVAGYAPVFWAEGGGAFLTGWPEDPPVYLRAPVDMNAGVMACLGIVSALHARARGGGGAHVDCSAIETVACSVGAELLAESNSLDVAGRAGNDRFPYAPNDVFPCAGDGNWLAISVCTEAQWQALCEVLRAVSLRDDPAYRHRLARWELREALYRAIASLTMPWPAGELEAALRSRNVPAARSMSLGALHQDPVLRERGFWTVIDHPLLGEQDVGGLPWQTNPPRTASRKGGPMMGAHNRAVIDEWLGAATQSRTGKEAHHG